MCISRMFAIGEGLARRCRTRKSPLATTENVRSIDE